MFHWNKIKIYLIMREIYSYYNKKIIIMCNKINKINKINNIRRIINCKKKYVWYAMTKQDLFLISHLRFRYTIQMHKPTLSYIVSCQTILDYIVSFNCPALVLSFESSGLYDPDDRGYRSTFRRTHRTLWKSRFYITHGNIKPKKSSTKKRPYANEFLVAFTWAWDKDGWSFTQTD